MPEKVNSVYTTGNAEFKTNILRFGYESMITPSTIFDYDMDSKKRTQLKQQEVPGYDPSQYATERTTATAADGAKIPVSVVYKKGLKLDGSAPLLLKGYGAYGSSYSVGFSAASLPLLDRGMVIAIAHIRGGGDMGKEWYEQGRMFHKKNTFTDFIAAAEHLIAQKYTSPEKLVATGGSAGGLLMGAVTNMRPDLFHVILNYVPTLTYQYDAGSDDPARSAGIQRMGKPGESERLRVHEILLPVHKHISEKIPGDPRASVLLGQPGPVLGSGKICCEDPVAENGSEPAAVENRIADGRPRRALRPVRFAPGRRS